MCDHTARLRRHYQHEDPPLRTVPAQAIHFTNHHESTTARRVGESYGWPLVELASGKRVVLNPPLNDIRPATPDEWETYQRERYGTPA